MQHRTVPQLVADLACAFPRLAVTADTVRVYARELADVDPAALEDAVRVLIRTAEFFPTVRAIRDVVAERALDLPSEADALAQLAARLAWGRAEEADRGEPPEIHPLVREALDHVGGWPALRSADKPEVVRGQFLRLYNGLRAASVRDHQVGPELALAPGQERRELTARSET